MRTDGYCPCVLKVYSVSSFCFALVVLLRLYAQKYAHKKTAKRPVKSTGLDDNNNKNPTQLNLETTARLRFVAIHSDI